MNSSKHRSDGARFNCRREPSDEFGDNSLDDGDLLQAAGGISDLDFAHIDNYGTELSAQTMKITSKSTRPKQTGELTTMWEPKQFDNGKWACNHACKDKNACKHMCCRDGVDKPPKAPKSWQAFASVENQDVQPKATQKQKRLQKGQTTLKLAGMRTKKPVSNAAASIVEHLDLIEDSGRGSRGSMPAGLKQLHRLHSSVQKDTPIHISSLIQRNDSRTRVTRSEQRLSFLPDIEINTNDITSDYGDSWPDDVDLPDLCPPTDAAGRATKRLAPSFDCNLGKIESDERVMISNDVVEPDFGEVDSLLDAAMVSLADSQDLQAETRINDRFTDIHQAPEDVSSLPITSKTLPFAKLPIFLSLDNSVKAREVHSQQVARRTPVLQSSSPFFTTTPTVKRSTFFPEVGDQSERARKRLKKIEDVELENMPPIPHVMVPTVPASEAKEESQRTEASSEPEGVDEWLMQEFGQYVDFV
jgi:hypothetical protein